jgi:hypothetical protein
MGLLNITGTVTAHGQSQFDNHLTIYAYLEITESSGRRIQIDRVAVCNDTAALLQWERRGIFLRQDVRLWAAFPLPTLGYQGREHGGVRPP